MRIPGNKFKIILLLVGCSIITALNSFGQTHLVKLCAGQLDFFRKGYIVTVNNDTTRGLIDPINDTGIYFIPVYYSIKITTFFGNIHKIPYFPSEDKTIKCFVRNGLYYEAHTLPQKDKIVFLNLYERGSINLYRQLYKYRDKSYSETIKKEEYQSNSSASFSKNYDDEYYETKNYYLTKEPDNQLIRISPYTGKFNDVFLPLIKDNKVFLEKLRDITVDVTNIAELVHQYNLSFIQSIGH